MKIFKSLKNLALVLSLIAPGLASAGMDPVAPDPNTGANFNRYAYANNNPYRFTDPDGRQSRELPYEFKYSGGKMPEPQFSFGAWMAVEFLSGFQDLNYRAPAGSGQVQSVVTPMEFSAASSLAQGAGAAVSAVRGGAAIADSALVVRGGSAAGANSVEGLARGTGTHPSGVTGFSAESANGATLCQLCGNIAHNQVGVTTAGEIRAAGGNVIATKGASPTHVTVTGLKPEAANRLLTPTRANPIPKVERLER